MCIEQKIKSPNHVITWNVVLNFFSSPSLLSCILLSMDVDNFEDRQRQLFTNQRKQRKRIWKERKKEVKSEG